MHRTVNWGGEGLLLVILLVLPVLLLSGNFFQLPLSVGFFPFLVDLVNVGLVLPPLRSPVWRPREYTSRKPKELGHPEQRVGIVYHIPNQREDVGPTREVNKITIPK